MGLVLEFLGSEHELGAMQEVMRMTDEHHDLVMRKMNDINQ